MRMRLICCVTLLFLLSVSKIQAQKVFYTEKRSSFHTYVRGDSFEGVVFSKDFAFPFLDNQSGERRFTPTLADIEAAEKILLTQLRIANASKLNQGGDCGPVIDQNLKLFVRQYYGYITEEGERVVYISCLNKGNYTITNSKAIPNWLKGAVVVLNGGSNYWQIQANLNKSQLFGLAVNGLDRSAGR
jgi:hypothetical protein